MASLPSCPGCGSDLVQPLRWQQRTAGEVLVELRCPECHVVMQACHSPAEMQELDRRQAALREQLVSAYEKAVAENMEAMVASLHEALARDLVGADDFATRALRPRRGPGTLPRAA